MVDVVYQTLCQIPNQMSQAWGEARKIELPAAYKKVKNVVVVGMGGSAFTPQIVKDLVFGQLEIPYEVIRNYRLPAYVNENSLVILSSYSGGTEETIYGGREALKRGAKILGITRGGELADFIKEHRLPGYIFKETYNPSGQPRFGGGYMILGHLAFLKNCQFIKVIDNEILRAIEFVKNMAKKWQIDIPEEKNLAKKISQALREKIPVIVSSEFLEGNGKGLQNQFHETAKNFANFQYIPELNHHLLEGLQFPKTNTQNLHFIFLESSLYHPQNVKRYLATMEIVSKYKVGFTKIKLTGSNKFEQSLEFFCLGSFITYYLSLDNKVNPQVVPWVDYFKKRIKEL